MDKGRKISVISPYPNILHNLADYTRKTFTGAQKHGYCCKACGSRLLHHTDGGKTVGVKGGAMPGLSAEMMETAVHIWIEEAVLDIPSGGVRYEGEPPGEA
ncbi:hypothetical protein AC579_5221 [Pseudocercospora musae]|uniref:CENP-V/GFA domain-containing protein n=1 Tax=Pseudocercospora musae TaxID=113226 RepID=A0A139IDM5_9PEZI|nr:hypothetical protein AC579_5221 [Pseudocercospora musae]